MVNRLDGLLRLWAEWTDEERAKPIDDLVLGTVARLARVCLELLPEEYGDELTLLALSGVKISPDFVPRDEADEDSTRLRVRQVQQYVTLMLDALVTEFELESEGPETPMVAQPMHVVTAHIPNRDRKPSSGTQRKSAGPGASLRY